MAKVTIHIGGKPYDVPELSLYQLRRTAKLGAKVIGLQGAPLTDENIDDTFDAVLDLVQLWLGDEYPKLTREGIEKAMTQSEMIAMTEAISPVMAASGVKAPGEGGGAAGA